MSKKQKLYLSPLAIGICADVNPYTDEAREICTRLEPSLIKCDWPTNYSDDCQTPEKCGEPTVVVAILEYLGHEEKSSFVGLCERHRQMGQWHPNVVLGWNE